MQVVLALVMLAASAAAPTPAPATEAEGECAAFNREEAERRANHRGPCPYCPCACGPNGVTCAPCVACNAVLPEPSPPDPPEPTFRITGRAVAVSRICGGGAAITQEMEDALPPPRPLPGKELLVVAGKKITAGPIVTRVVADGKGQFVAQLPRGTWCFFAAGRRLTKEALSEPMAAPKDAHIDAACLADLRRQCDRIVGVTRDARNVEVAFYDPCPQQWNQPCYRGPMPP